jgi:hypothetical protein
MFNIYFKEMKKFFSLIALVGAIAACTPEQLETAFTLSGATADVTINVVDLRTGAAYDGVYNILVNGTAINGNKWSASASEGQPIAEQTLNIEITSDKFNGEQAFTTTHQVPKVLAGGHYNGVAKVIVYEGTIQSGDWTFDIKRKLLDYSTEVKYLVNNHYPTHSHASPVGDDEISWYYNNSEFYLTGVVEYTLTEGSEIVDESGCLYPGHETAYNTLVENLSKDEVETIGEKKEIWVSAWSMWTAWVEQYMSELEYTLTATNDITKEEAVVGTVTTREYAGTSFQYRELPYPGAPGHAHYHAGHGHGHGGDNAGGGLAVNE